MATLTAELLRLRGPADIRLLRSVLSNGCRPNVVVRCETGELASVTRSVKRWCATPRHICRPGDALDLPPSGTVTTLVIPDVTGLDLEDQIELCDWISCNRQTQVVCITARAMKPLVDRGLFLEGLYHRLNVIQLDVAPAARPWYPWAWTFEGMSR